MDETYNSSNLSLRITLENPFSYLHWNQNKMEIKTINKSRHVEMKMNIRSNVEKSNDSSAEIPSPLILCKNCKVGWWFWLTTTIEIKNNEIPKSYSSFKSGTKSPKNTHTEDDSEKIACKKKHTWFKWRKILRFFPVLQKSTEMAQHLKKVNTDWLSVSSVTQLCLYLYLCLITHTPLLF